MKTGSLDVVGSGIRAVAQLTSEARRCIEAADVLYHAVSDRVTLHWLERHHPAAVSLSTFYTEGGDRLETYRLMIDALVSPVRAGRRVCAVFYGHPGVFVYPTHAAIRQLRAEGLPARMLPGISASDCLFADLGVDPGRGFQMFAATDFVLHPRRLDPAAHVIFWQIDSIGDNSYRATGNDARNLPQLLSALDVHYPPGQPVCLYEAAVMPVGRAVTRWLTLRELRGGAAVLDGMSTLYIPPMRAPRPDPAMAQHLGLPDF
jgi:precorrin-6B methylase 1